MPSVICSLTIPDSRVAKDIAERLYERMYYGKVVIIVDKPRVFISPLRKRWLRLLRGTMIERARTLNPAKITEFEGAASYMKELRFTLRYPLGEYPGDVYVVDLATALHWPPDCSTLFIATQIEKHEQYLVSAWMPRGGLIVLYGQAK